MDETSCSLIQYENADISCYAPTSSSDDQCIQTDISITSTRPLVDSSYLPSLDHATTAAQEFPELPVHSDVTLQLWSDPWHQAREYRKKVYEPPYVEPSSDSTIFEVEQDAEFWVRQLVLAMMNTEDVKDTEGSRAKKMFLPGSCDPLLIECTSREIFLALLDQCKHGFRSPAQYNKALKPTRGLEKDKSATCEERLGNIIRVLNSNKRVCKDVLYEDWKIRLLVNHPLACDKEKDSQKGSNDQRRRRQQLEREKLKKTEEQLRMYRMADGQAMVTGDGGRSNAGAGYGFQTDGTLTEARVGQACASPQLQPAIRSGNTAS
ncbi:hypothetical protein BS50DRAFT_578109 [Corynespora cassiicola Philippines]|uniref:Uncharacterized protein n=1 Tax=Corynespora cassiicola Philippines TaxID=1448308 RepID=A0A2T2NAM3_CORCC|nr:hypothetical protein BS50DRAFT_578109 [Corynespora cassiicola Philippines]